MSRQPGALPPLQVETRSSSPHTSRGWMVVGRVAGVEDPRWCTSSVTSGTVPQTRGGVPSLVAMATDSTSHATLHYCSIRLKVPAHLSRDHTPSLAAEQEPTPSRSTVPSVSWLVDVLLPRVAQWAGEGGAGVAQAVPAHPSLVPLERFAATYSRMKEQYGRQLVQVHVLKQCLIT